MEEGAIGRNVAQYIIQFRVMDIERNSKGSRFSNQQNQDRSSYRSSVMSLERFSDRRHSSLSNRVSLVNAMDIQVSNRSQHDDLLDPDGNRFSDLRRASHKSKQQVYSFAAEMEEKDLNRKSQYKIQHECKCVEEQCMGVHCICFLTPRQICVIGQCCPQCIAIKNEYLQVTRGFQVRRRGEERTKQEESEALKQIRQRKCNNMHYMKQVYANDPTIRDLIFCTCKKSHCQKKYCLCYEKGQKCGEFCVCIECQNRIPEEDEDYFREEEQRRWQRYATYKPYEQQENDKQNQIDQDIEQFIEEEVPQQGCFNETMEFEPVNFDHLGS